MKVLLIEPHRPLAQTYAAWLRTLGCQVSVAKSAQSAIHVADEDVPDIIVLELQMAKHNGVEFLYEFRSYSEWREVPIVLHTMIPADSLHLNEQQLRLLGIAAYLYKPTTTLMVLARTIKEIVGEEKIENPDNYDRHHTLAQGLSGS